MLRFSCWLGLALFGLTTAAQSADPGDAPTPDTPPVPRAAQPGLPEVQDLLDRLSVPEQDTLDERADTSVPAAEEAASPLQQIAGKMGQVATSIDTGETGQPTQTRQQEIIDELDAVISQLDKACQACQQAMQGNAARTPSSPLADSVRIKRGGTHGKMRTPGSGGDDWAKLPPHRREQILQSMTEGFPPSYRAVLEQYFRRLAEEEDSSTAQPGTTPGESEVDAAAADTDGSIGPEASETVPDRAFDDASSDADADPSDAP